MIIQWRVFFMIIKILINADIVYGQKKKKKESFFFNKNQEENLLVILFDLSWIIISKLEEADLSSDLTFFSMISLWVISLFKWFRSFNNFSTLESRVWSLVKSLVITIESLASDHVYDQQHCYIEMVKVTE